MTADLSLYCKIECRCDVIQALHLINNKLIIDLIVIILPYFILLIYLTYLN